MEYNLEVSDKADKSLRKLAKKDPRQHVAVFKKVKQILENPYSFKPLKKPLQNQWRVHVNHFVLTYMIDEENKTVRITSYKHHDEVYESA